MRILLFIWHMQKRLLEVYCARVCVCMCGRMQVRARMHADLVLSHFHPDMYPSGWKRMALLVLYFGPSNLLEPEVRTFMSCASSRLEDQFV